MVKKLASVFSFVYVVNLVVLLILLAVSPAIQLSVFQIGELMGLNLVASGVETGLVWLIRQPQLHKIAVLKGKIEGIQNAAPPTHVLLRPDDDLYQLAMAINNLQTHQRRLLETQRHQDAEMSLLLTSLPVGVMVIDRYRKVELANRAMGAFLETTIDEQRHPYTQDIKNYELATLISQAIEARATQQATVTLMAVPTPRTVEATVLYAPSPHNDFFAIVLLYDITEIAAIEKMQRDFLTNASHELKTPVTAITGFAETLLAGAKDDPGTLTKFLGIIQREGARLTDLITDVLSISRIESQTVAAPKLMKVLLADLVDEQFEVMQQSAAGQSIELVNAVDQHAVILADRDKLIEILKNLISNAIKYNRPNGQVRVSYQQTAAQWTLTVADTGIGISQADQTRVFERFYRVDSSRNKQVVTGTGLGLAIVAELVAAMKGQIHLESQRGVGTSFVVTIPQSHATPDR